MCLGHELKANTCRNSTVEKNSPTSGPPVSIEPTLSDAVKARRRFNFCRGTYQLFPTCVRFPPEITVPLPSRNLSKDNQMIGLEKQAKALIASVIRPDTLYFGTR